MHFYGTDYSLFSQYIGIGRTKLHRTGTIQSYDPQQGKGIIR